MCDKSFICAPVQIERLKQIDWIWKKWHNYKLTLPEESSYVSLFFFFLKPSLVNLQKPAKTAIHQGLQF